MKTSSVISGIKCRLNDWAFGGTMNHFLRKRYDEIRRTIKKARTYFNRSLIMREIKFRGKSTTYKKWKYGTPVNLEQGTIIIEERGVFNDGSASPFFSKWDLLCLTLSVSTQA